MKLESADKLAHAPAHDADELAFAVIDNQAQGIAVLDHQGNIVIWNSWMSAWTGITNVQSVGQCLEALVPAIIGDEYARAVKSAIETGKSTAWSSDVDPQRLDMIEAAMTRGDRLLPLSRISIKSLPVYDRQGCLLEFIEAPFSPVQLCNVNTNEPPSVRPATQEIESQRFPVCLESPDSGVLSVNAEGIILDVNDQLLTQTGYSRHQLVDAPMRLLFPSLNENGEIEDYRELLDTRIRQNSDEVIEAAAANGEPRNFKVSVYPSISEKEVFVLLCQEYSWQLGIQDAVRRQREMLATVLDQVADGVAFLDRKGIIEQINPAGLAMLGMRLDQVQGAAVESVINMVDDEGRSVSPCRDALSCGSECSMPDNTLLLVEGREQTSISGAATPLRDRHNQLMGCALVFRSIEESRRVSSRLLLQANYDPVTKLPNRRALENLLVNAVDTARSDQLEQALLYIDVHNFSLVNETGGRSAGDTLLLECGKLLQKVVGGEHMVARIGNDEFAVLLHNCSSEEARRVTDAILEEVKSFSFPWQEKQLKIGVNIGVELIDHQTSSEVDVLVAAASSCVAAKEIGRNRVIINQHHNQNLVNRNSSQWIPKINEALEQDRFCLYYQPITPVAGDVMEHTHFEALVRMEDKSGQLVAPSKFIPPAELYGLIDDIDRWVVRRVITELTSNKLSKHQNLRISINLSGATIGDEHFKDYLLELIDVSKINPHQLQFEITETAAVKQFDQALDLIHALKDKGCYFSLDDFGSGLSSFGSLRELPVDFLKIDGSFVRNIQANDIDRSMVGTINHLAHIMGIATIAENVENQAQLNILEKLGVDYAQGFFIAPPQEIGKLFL